MPERARETGVGWRSLIEASSLAASEDTRVLPPCGRLSGVSTKRAPEKFGHRPSQVESPGSHFFDILVAHLSSCSCVLTY